MNNVMLHIPPILRLTAEQFEQLAAANQDLRLELTAAGELLIMPPTGEETGKRNFDLNGQLWLWNRQNRLGIAFDSSTGFRLPNGSIRSPDASWVKMARWEALTQKQKQKFLPLCPDFAVELLSETDELEDTQKKMQEYLENGLRLGWLINPKLQQVEISRPNQPIEVLQTPKTLSGEDILPGFILDLEQIFPALG